MNSFIAHQQDKESHLFPFWCTISLEILCRAALSFVHPALLADPTKGSNLLYVFGFYKEKEPVKSIPIKTVLERLTHIVDTFTKKEFDICMNFMERRNRELHSGAAAFEDYPTKIWLADFYRICNILIKFQGKELSDWLSEDDASIALEMIKKDHNKIIKRVGDLIKIHKDEFYRKSKPDQEVLRLKADNSTLFGMAPQVPYWSTAKCPACSSKGLISGQISRSGEPYLDGEEIVRKISILPCDFHCWACELKLSGYDQLQAADLGGYITEEERWEAQEYYNFDPSDYYEEYGND